MRQQHLGMGYEEGVGSGLDQLGDLVVRRLQSERP
jgi:hypothetical protein